MLVQSLPVSLLSLIGEIKSHENLLVKNFSDPYDDSVE